MYYAETHVSKVVWVLRQATSEAVAASAMAELQVARTDTERERKLRRTAEAEVAMARRATQEAEAVRTNKLQEVMSGLRSAMTQGELWRKELEREQREHRLGRAQQADERQRWAAQLEEERRTRLIQVAHLEERLRAGLGVEDGSRSSAKDIESVGKETRTARMPTSCAEATGSQRTGRDLHIGASLSPLAREEGKRQALNIFQSDAARLKNKSQGSVPRTILSEIPLLNSPERGMDMFVGLDSCSDISEPSLSSLLQREKQEQQEQQQYSSYRSSMPHQQNSHKQPYLYATPPPSLTPARWRARMGRTVKTCLDRIIDVQLADAMERWLEQIAWHNHQLWMEEARREGMQLGWEEGRRKGLEEGRRREGQFQRQRDSSSSSSTRTSNTSSASANSSGSSWGSGCPVQDQLVAKAKVLQNY